VRRNTTIAFVTLVILVLLFSYRSSTGVSLRDDLAMVAPGLTGHDDAGGEGQAAGSGEAPDDQGGDGGVQEQPAGGEAPEAGAADPGPGKKPGGGTVKKPGKPGSGAKPTKQPTAGKPASPVKPGGPAPTKATPTKEPVVKPTATKPATKPPAAQPPASKTVTGQTVDTRFGPVQVQVTVTGGKITAVKVLQQPTGNGKSDSINNNAMPKLVQQTLAAQSADVDTVSGATFSSDGYRKSLQSALDAAGL
jgi:uncharacterized protein with FMN-binding domain